MLDIGLKWYNKNMSKTGKVSRVLSH